MVRKQKFMAMGAVALMAVMVMAAVVPLMADGSDAAITDDLTYSYDSSTKTLTIGGTGPMKDYSSSSNIGTQYPDLTTVIIGNGVTSIGDYAFNRCTGLTTVIIGNGVTSIGDYAFNRCTGLTVVTIPNSVTSIGANTFYYCKSLTTVIIGDGVTSIGDYAFSECTGLTAIYIASSVAFTRGDYGTSSNVDVVQGYLTVDFTVQDAVIIAGTTYSATVASNGYDVTVFGADWLTASDNTVSGTPTTPGTYNVTVSCYGQSATMTIKVISKLDVTNSPAGGLIVMPR